MGVARTVNHRCQSGLWEGSSADSSSRFLTNAKDGLKKSLVARLTPEVVRYTCFPSPYYSSPRNLLLHHFTRQDLRSARSVSPVNSYGSCSKSSHRTSYRRSHSGATCQAGEQLPAYGTRCKRKSRSSSNLCGSQSTPSHCAECGTNCAELPIGSPPLSSSPERR